MNIKQFAGYKVVEVDGNTIIINCKDLRKGLKFDKTDDLPRVPKGFPKTTKTPKILLRKMSFKKLVKRTPKNRANKRASKPVRKVKVIKKVICEFCDCIFETDRNSKRFCSLQCHKLEYFCRRAI